ncbi:MAG: serine/threonine-protein kinase [Vicinamibacteria bacterium]|nr:serine/threonine-protein kinase [Vicinamibacteria bacterium]
MQEDAGGLSRLVGATLDGKYRLVGVLGCGGMGVVYQATHLGTRRTVALKVIAPRFLSDPEFVERFRREAEAAGRLRHPNVVDVTDFGFGEADGVRLAYLVMEFLDGCTLDEVLREEKTLPLRWVADVLEQACSAVAEAHKRGIVHRDLKPSNLWLEPDRRGGYTVKVLDFGLARVAESEAGLSLPAGPATTAKPTPNPTAESADEEAATLVRGVADADPEADAAETRVRPDTTVPPGATDAPHLTRLGTALGTPLYMSPEQWRGEPAGPGSDVYSLGVIAWQLLAGSPPFPVPGGDLRRGHLETPPPALPSTVPPALATLVTRALAKVPADRPPSAAAFGASFAARAEGAGTTLRQVLGLLIDHPRLFFGVPAVALLPCLLWLLAGNALTPEAQAPLARVGLGLAVALPGLLLFFTGLQAGSALLLPVVAQALAMPLRPIVLRPLVRALGQRFRAFARLVATFFWGYVKWVLLPPFGSAAAIFALRDVVPRPWRGVLIIGAMVPAWALTAIWAVRLGDLGFAAAAILMEGLDASAAMERSRALAAAAKRDLRGFERVRAVLLVAGLGVGLGVGSGLATFAEDGAGPGLRLAIAAAAFAGLSVMCAFFFAIGALQYFKARQSAGEPLAEVLAQFERLALPAGYWQQRVRERVRLDVETSR